MTRIWHKFDFRNVIFWAFFLVFLLANSFCRLVVQLYEFLMHFHLFQQVRYNNNIYLASQYLMSRKGIQYVLHMKAAIWRRLFPALHLLWKEKENITPSQSIFRNWQKENICLSVIKAPILILCTTKMSLNTVNQIIHSCVR